MVKVCAGTAMAAAAHSPKTAPDAFTILCMDVS
jgi:hypothetical protein